MLEWVGYHRAIGFDRVLIFTNDCEDGTDAMADRLAEIGLAVHERNSGTPDKGPQWAALRSDALKDALRRADWAAHLDVDEFLNVFAGQGRVGDVLDDEMDAIAVPWRFFGSAGHMRFQDQPVTEQFTDAGPCPAPFPRVALMFKSLFRPASFQKPGVHAPKARSDERPRWRVANGRAASNAFSPERSMLVGADAGNALAQVNHYAVKSAESFLVKSARGLPNKRHLEIDLSYWVQRNSGGEADERLATRDVAASARAELLQDAELARLHGGACAWHRAKAAAMLETEAGMQLYSAISMTGASRVPDRAEIARIYGAMTRIYGGEGRR